MPMTLKAYHMPGHCTGVYDSMRQNFTTPESYHGSSHLILGDDVLKVNRGINAANATCNLPGIHSCTNRIWLANVACALPDDPAFVSCSPLFQEQRIGLIEMNEDIFFFFFWRSAVSLNAAKHLIPRFLLFLSLSAHTAWKPSKWLLKL